MADYHSPTIVQPSIPNADITPLERLVLGSVFDVESDGDALYFFTELGPRDTFELPVEEFRAAFSASAGVRSSAYDYLRHTMATLDATTEFTEIDFSGTSWNFIFQDIIQRSATLDYIYVLTAFTCTKMRPDGFGGMVVFVTANTVEGKSTFDILHEFITRLDGSGAGA